jgi:DNA-binding response OmpR family regulator
VIEIASGQDDSGGMILTLTVAILSEDDRVGPLLGDTLKLLGVQIAKSMTELVDAVILDHPDTQTFIAEIKSLSETVPIIVLGGNAVDDADLVLSKPLRAFTLVRHIEALVSRTGLVFGPWRFYPKIRVLKNANGQSEALTQKESDLLDYLFQADRLVSRDELLSEVFGYTAAVSTHTVETHIHTLRKKLGADLLITEEAGYGLKS